MRRKQPHISIQLALGSSAAARPPRPQRTGPKRTGSNRRPWLLLGSLLGGLSGGVGVAQGVASAPFATLIQVTTTLATVPTVATPTATPITPTLSPRATQDEAQPTQPTQPATSSPSSSTPAVAPSATTSTSTIGQTQQPLSLKDATLAASACQLPSGTLPRLNRTVFVLDTSGSMQGKGDGKADIFQQVKDSIDEYVETTQPNAIELITFDSGVGQTKSYAWPSDAERFKKDLSSIKAEGNNTYLYRSLQNVLKPLSSPDQYVTNVFVLTDGIDNDPDKRNTAQTALASFEKRGALDTLSYIALGTEIPESARKAILESNYASGLTMPVGQVPKLFEIGIATQLLSAKDPNSVPAPFPDGTLLKLNSSDSNLALTQAEVANRSVRVSAPVSLSVGTPALLCAPPDPRNNVVGARLRRALVTLNFAGGSGNLLLLNPHSSQRVLRAGGDLRLIYRAEPSLDLAKESLHIEMPSQAGGVEGTIRRVRGAREFVVHYRSSGSLVNAEVSPTLKLGKSGRSILLDSLTLRGDGSVSMNPTSLEGEAKNPSFWLSVATALGLLLLAALIYFPVIFWDRRHELASNMGNSIKGGFKRLSDKKPKVHSQRGAKGNNAAAAVPPSAGQLATGQAGEGQQLAGQNYPAHTDSAAAAARRLGRVTTRPPSLQGLEYSTSRHLLLLDQTDGRTPVPMPAAGPFDVGLLARVPHLRDLRVDQRPEGLRLLNIPQDLHVHDNLHRLREGDIVPAGTVLGIQIVNPHRASYAALGKLVGLGLPLMLDTRGGGLRLSGPYAEHMLALHPGINDLGDLVGAPALMGLKLSISGPRILLAGIPAGMVLTDTTSTQVLHAGAYLPNQTHIRLPDNLPQISPQQPIQLDQADQTSQIDQASPVNPADQTRKNYE